MGYAKTRLQGIEAAMKISNIKIGSRFRKDLGDIDNLVKTIQDVGLLQPIGTNEDNELVYGARRLEACKRLGWSEIPVNVIPLKDIIKGEFIENSERKDFTFSERQAILEEIESQRLGHRQKKKKVSKLGTFQQDNKGKPSVDIVSEYTGVSTGQLSKEKKIIQAVKQKPQLKYVVNQLDSGEISVNEADQIIKYSEDQEAESKKRGKWIKLREEVLKSDSYKCRDCGSDLHLDVYTIESFLDKHELENLETLCKDCHKLKMRFHDDIGLVGSLIWIFQGLTGFSGKKYFQYNVIGHNMISDSIKNNKKEDLSPSYYYDDYTKQMEASPYAKLKSGSYAELVSKTRDYRKHVIQTIPKDAHEIYVTQEALHQLIPILKDYSEMIDKEADARRRKDKLSKP